MPVASSLDSETEISAVEIAPRTRCEEKGVILEEGMLRERKTSWKDWLEGARRRVREVRDREIAGENPRYVNKDGAYDRGG